MALMGLPLIGIAAYANAFAAPADLRIVINFFITLVLVLGLQLFAGTSGIISFGHAGFIGLGAYVTAVMTIPPSLKEEVMHGLPHGLLVINTGTLPAIAIAGAVTGLIAALIGVPLTRMREDAMMMATFGVLVIFFVTFRSWESVTGGSIGVFGLPKGTTIYTALVFAILSIGACRAFRESKTGIKLQASSGDEIAAEALGANVVRLRWIAWVLSAVLMGVGGALFAAQNVAFSPRQFYFTVTFTLFAILVIGGLPSVTGAVVGAAAVTVVSELLRRLEVVVGVEGLQQIAVALIILMMLRFRPGGLLGRRELDDLIRRKWTRQR